MKTQCKYCFDGTCDTCDGKETVERVLKPTVRITTKCTQSCDHCCFSCSPKRHDMMTVGQARKVARFLRKYEIRYINVMGGEFFCNPYWEEIFYLLIKEVMIMRLVTNGDWAENEKVKEKLKKFMTHDETKHIYLCISGDKWHDLENTEKALEWLKENNLEGKVGKMEDRAVVPIGRGWAHSTFYSSMGCYCRSKDNRYDFLIDEEGNVYKCPFGLLKIFNVGDDDKDFFEKFKTINKRMQDIFIPSCKACVRALTGV